MKYNIEMLSEEICFIDFETVFERGMTFLRSQEYKENPKYAGKSFSLLEFISDYGKENGKFSYPEDWEGFNVSFDDINDALNMAIKINDYNRYDVAMDMIVDEVYSLSPSISYFISCNPNDEETLNHELAHAFFYLDGKYKREISKLELNKGTQEIFENIKKQYHSNVWDDEFQAWLINDDSRAKKIFLETKARHGIKLP